MVLKSYLTLNKLEQLKTKQKSLEYQPAHFEKITMPWPGKKHSFEFGLISTNHKNHLCRSHCRSCRSKVNRC